MPSRRVHEALDRIFLGRKFSQVHRLIDLPARNMGKKHRTLFHDPLSAIAIGYTVGGWMVRCRPYSTSRQTTSSRS